MKQNSIAAISSIMLAIAALGSPKTQFANAANTPEQDTTLIKELYDIDSILYCKIYYDQNNIIQYDFFSRDGHKINGYNQIEDSEIVDSLIDAFYREYNVNDETWIPERPFRFIVLLYTSFEGIKTEVRLPVGSHEDFDKEAHRVASVLESTISQILSCSPPEKHNAAIVVKFDLHFDR